MNNENKLIEKCKKFNYNFLWNQSNFWMGLVFILCLSPFYGMIEVFFDSDVLKYIICMVCLILAVVGQFLYKSIMQRPKIEPFRKSRHFVGIYSIDDLYINKDYYEDVLISRIHEVKYLRGILDKIFLQETEKQSICIIGQSGTGKSTIINRLKIQLKDEENSINIIDCTDRYKDIKRYVLKKFMVETLEELYDKLEKSSQKILFVFDQFERFFYLSYCEQLQIRNILFNKLKLKNVASIFVLRSDYFTDFIYSLNIDEYIVPKGILSNLSSDNWENKYLLYCKNTTDENFPRNYDEYQENIIENRNDDIRILCMRSFDEMGKEVYDRFQDKKLIEKQMLLNLLENKCETPHFEEYFRKNTDRDLIIQYYDKQLCSTGDYYTSAQIMYLLSAGRIYNLFYRKQQIYEALLIGKDVDVKNINVILEKLCELQLIKLVQRDDINYFEIVHDYIAESFLEYAEVNLHEYVKNTLDDYRVNYRNTEYLQNIRECINLKKGTKTFEISILIMVFSIITLHSVYQFYNWGNFYPLFVNLPLYMATYYGYCLYTNIFKLYIGKNKVIIYCLYVGMALCVILANVYYKFWLIFAGVGTLLIGMAFSVIHSSKKISRVAKQFYSDFCNKVSCTGLVIGVTGFIFYYTNTNFYIGIMLIVAELIYAYIAQLSEEYFYYCVGMMNSR